MNTVDSIAEYNILSSQKFDEAEVILREIQERFIGLQQEKGIAPLREGERRVRIGRDVLKTLYLGQYNPSCLTTDVTVECVAKAMALIEIGSVSSELRAWINGHDVNSAMAKISCPSYAFQHHIPTEDITHRVKELMRVYEPISETL